MKVINHFLYGNDGKQVTYRPSPNHGGVKVPKYLIVHYDASATAEGAISWMVSPKSEVSAELHIARDGKVVQLVPFNLTAWHAGKSYWNGINGLNSHSIGIELQNTGTQEYTQVQLEVLVEVAKALFEAYKLEDTMGHMDISPGRKQDPGKQFPMEWFKKQIGLTGGKVQTAKTTTDVNIRKGAGTTFSSLGVLSKGTELNVLSKGSEWSEVFVCSQKLTGYVSNKYLA